MTKYTIIIHHTCPKRRSTWTSTTTLEFKSYSEAAEFAENLAFDLGHTDVIITIF